MSEDNIEKLAMVIGIGILTLALWIIINEWEFKREYAALDQRIQAIERRLGAP